MLAHERKRLHGAAGEIQCFVVVYDRLLTVKKQTTQSELCKLLATCIQACLAVFLKRDPLVTVGGGSHFA